MNRFVASRLLRCNYSIAYRGVLPVRRLASSLVSGFDASISALPMREAVRYKEKNIKWTSSEFQVNSDPFLAHSACDTLAYLTFFCIYAFRPTWMPKQTGSSTWNSRRVRPSRCG